MSEKPKKNFDFQDKFQLSDSLSHFLAEKERFFKEKILRQKLNNSRFVWVLIGMLTISLIGLGYFGYFEVQKRDTEIEQILQRTRQVAGETTDIQTETRVPPITSSLFSILPTQTPPKEFQKIREAESSLAFDLTDEVVFGFVAEIENDNQIKQSGIKVWAKEYDDNLNFDNFATELESNLGENYELTDQRINLPNSIQLGKFEDKRSEEQSYYFTVTADNYYFIEIIEETKDNPDLEEINDFTSKIFNWLYLN